MKRLRHSALVATFAIVFVHTSQAQLFNIERSPAIGTVIVENSVNPNNATYARIIIEATRTDVPTFINLRANSPGNDIDYFIVRINTPQLVIVEATGATAGSSFDDLRSIDFVVINNSIGDLIISNLRATRIGAPSEVLGPRLVRAHGLNDGRITGNVDAGAVIMIEDRDPNSTSTNGQIPYLEVGGNLLGDVICTSGFINQLLVTGSIGSPGQPVTITAGPGVGGGIGALTAASINANIHGHGSLTTPLPVINLLKAASGGFAGSLTAASIVGGTGETGLRVTGGLTANATISQSVSNPIVITGGLPGSGALSIGASCSGGISIDSLTSTKTVLIGGSLSGNTNIGAGGLSGQIVVNSNNAGGTWASPATATVGTIPLAPLPAYEMCSMTLGNGAIGRVPFQLYDTDCMPPNHPAPENAGSVGETNFYGGGQVINVRFYGPITVASGTDPAAGVKVERFDGSTWVDVTDSFSLSFQAPNGVTYREIRVIDNVSAPDTGQGLYHLVPRINDGNILLLCDIPVPVGQSGKPSVANFEYRFSIVDGCHDPRTDFNNDGDNNPDDLGDYITCYFSTPPCAGADFNCDNNVNPDDLGDFITAYFAPDC